jgi:hypothetical protein
MVRACPECGGDLIELEPEAALGSRPVRYVCPESASSPSRLTMPAGCARSTDFAQLLPHGPGLARDPWVKGQPAVKHTASRSLPLLVYEGINRHPCSLLFVDGLGASRNDMRFVPGAGSETSLKLGAILEFALIGFNVATAAP